MTKITGFGYLGTSFQLKLLSQIILDPKFGDSIIPVINPKYFDNQNYRQLMVMVKDYYEKYESIPNFENLKQLIALEIKDDIQREYLVAIIKEISELTTEDSEFIKDKALKFCKQQELKKAVQRISGILEKGDFENYDQCEDILRKATVVGEDTDEGVEVMHSINDVLSDDFRKPIPTGIEGIDNCIGGGLGKGELGIFLAAMGVGKSTILTKFANTAYNLGHTVLQIVFEDNPKIIQRKHIACWTGIELNKLSERKEEVLQKLEPFKNRGKLIIKRFSSDETTIPVIKQYLRKLHSRGIRPDIVLLDYIDCIAPNRINNGDQTQNEGSIVRQYESMAVEFDFAAWTAIQGNRSAIQSEVVEMDQMGGSIKRGQVGHLVISAAKTLQQKELGLANMAILKSRFGKDGIIFKNMTFDNGRVIFDCKESNLVTSLGFEQERNEASEVKARERVQAVIAGMRDAKKQASNPTEPKSDVLGEEKNNY